MLRNKFKRLTLVDEHFTHRVTIDYDLAFNHVNLSTLTKEYRVDRLAIIEIKTTRTFDKNGIHQALYNLNIHPNGFSKYCMGRYYTEPQIAKSNSLKPKLLTINKIISC